MATKYLTDIRRTIASIEKNSSLFEKKNFSARIDAIDFLEFQIIGQIENLIANSRSSDELITLKNYAEKVKTALEEIDEILFKDLHLKIRKGLRGRELINVINEFYSLDIFHHSENTGYDNLDIFINHLISVGDVPEPMRELERGMVSYQKTPAKIIFELAEKDFFRSEEIFLDIGSGLGHVAILVHLLTGVRSKGIEIDPAFCDYARRCAHDLNVPDAEFIKADARDADYSDGTIFFMYTPFTGEILQEVLERLRQESLSRKIRIVSYGPCTAQIAQQKWLLADNAKLDENALTVFRSC